MKKLINLVGIFSIFDGVWTLFGGKTLIRSEGWVEPSLTYSLVSILSGAIFILISHIFFKDNV